MRRRNTQTLKELLDEVLKANRLDTKLYETRLMDSWKSVLGNTVAQYTGAMYIRNQVLYVQITSAVLRNDLQFARQKLVENLNRHLEREVIRDIVFR